MRLIYFEPKYKVGEFVLGDICGDDVLMKVICSEFKRDNGDWFKHNYYDGGRVPLKKIILLVIMVWFVKLEIGEKEI